MRDFSLSEVHDLVDAAQAQSSVDTAACAPFSYTGLKIIETLYSLLRRHVSPELVTEIMGELREYLAEGMDFASQGKFYQTVSHCVRCPNLVHPPQMPVGSEIKPAVVVVTESPLRSGAKEELAQTLRAAGFDMSQVSATFATRCLPIAPRTPEAAELTNCQEWLITELEMMNPDLIISFGSTPTRSLLGPVGITQVHGQFFFLGRFVIFPVYSLPYIKREAVHGEALHADLVKAHTWLTSCEV